MNSCRECRGKLWIPLEGDEWCEKLWSGWSHKWTSCLLYAWYVRTLFLTISSSITLSIFLKTMLTRLPEVLSIDILSNWCDLQTVAKVNSAFCNKVNRSDFLCLLSDPKFASTDSSYQSSMEFREWIESKGIKLQYLSCEHMSSKLLTNADCSKAHEAALTVCQFHHNSSEDTLDAFLPLISNQILSGLVDFTILGCPNDLTNISIFCKELRSFSLLRCRNGSPYNMLV